MSLALFVLLGIALIVRADFGMHPLTYWGELGFWILLVMVMNLLPVTVDDIQLTLDLPLLMAVVILYGPEEAALVGFLATVDSRAIADEFTAWRSLFNRSQVAISVFAAGLLFEFAAGGLWPLSRSLPALAAALLVDYIVNTGAVMAHVSLTRRIGMRDSAALLVRRPAHFVATYFAYGSLSILLSILFIEVGAWSVLAFLVPLFGARQLLIKGQALQHVTGQLRTHQRLLEEALERIEEERKNERVRIAADLHDDVLQNLIHLRMLLSLLCKKKESGRQGEELEEVLASSDLAIGGLRDVISGLNRSPLGEGGLAHELGRLVHKLQEEWGIAIDYTAPSRVVLSGDVELVVYQVAREAIRNALKHSGAARVLVRLEVRNDACALEVEDNGRGFVVTPPRTQEQHFGLGLMRSRVDQRGGELAIYSKPGKGTRLRATIPLEG